MKFDDVPVGGPAPLDRPAAEHPEKAVTAPVERLLAQYGAHARPLREIVALLTEGPHALSSLIHATAAPRRTVEQVLAALGEDVADEPAGFAIRPERREAYRRHVGYAQLAATRLADPLAARLAEAAGLRGTLADLIRRAPRSRRALDHVAATTETAAWRGLWLDANYDLAGARLLCVGDHDLTSLSVGLVNREAAVTVVDLDERVLEYIDTEARRLGLDVRCLMADLRLGLPAAAAETADLAFTDPPYTPEGVRLFLARAAEGLRDRERGRLLMAYGFSDRTPGLGLKVQQAVGELALAYEAILPHVQRYHGAEAIGSASDLYICRPTARTWKVLDRVATGATHIYTHGPQSLEAAGQVLDGAVLDALGEALGEPATVHVGSGWPAGQVIRLGLDRLIAAGLPAAAAVRGRAVAAIDLSDDPGPLLLRALLAANADRLTALVPNDHPDLASAAGQAALADLLAPKYALRYLRSAPAPDLAVVLAVARDVERLDAAGRLVRRLLDRAHGKVANVWRDGLVAATGSTKNVARAAVQASAPHQDVLDGALIALPRHLLGPLLAGVRASAG